MMRLVLRRAAGHKRAVGRLARRGHGRGQRRRAAAHGARRRRQPGARHGSFYVDRPLEHRAGAAAGPPLLPLHVIYDRLCHRGAGWYDALRAAQVAAIPFQWPAFSRTPQGRNPLYSCFCAGQGDAQRTDETKTQPAYAATAGRTSQQPHRGGHTFLSTYLLCDILNGASAICAVHPAKTSITFS